METKYINIKTNYGIETIEEIRQQEFKTRKDYVKEYKRLLYEYRLNGQSVYLSQRACKDYNKQN